MPFNLFHRKKPEQEEPEAAPTTEQAPEPTPEAPVKAAFEPIESEMVEESKTNLQSEPEPKPEPESPAAEPEPQEHPGEQPAEAPIALEPQPEPEQPVKSPSEEPQAPLEPEPTSKIYLKAMPLKELTDVENVKEAVTNGNIIILRITPLAGKSIEDVKKAVNDLFEFSESVGGDIARLGEERVVICPKTVRIWREKTPVPVPKRDPLPPTTA